MAAESEFSWESWLQFASQCRPHLLPKPCTDTLAYELIDWPSMVRLGVIVAYVNGPRPGEPDLLAYVAEGRFHA